MVQSRRTGGAVKGDWWYSPAGQVVQSSRTRGAV